MKLLRIFILILLIGITSCRTGREVKGSSTLIELSDSGDYIRPIQTPTGYYYNDPRNGKRIEWKKKN